MADDTVAQAADKPGAATFSSFINKNTTGKKFAPKAARRRPAATSSTAATPSTAAASATATAKPAPAPPQPKSTESSAATTQPTPAQSTAQTTTQTTTQTTAQPITQPTTQSTPTPAVQPSPTPTPTLDHTHHDHHGPPSPKRRRIHSPSHQPTTTTMMPVAVMLPQPDVSTLTVIAEQPPPTDQTPSTQPSTTEQPSTTLQPPTDGQPTPPQEDPSPDSTVPAQPKRRRRTLPWTAVNHPQDSTEQEAEPTDNPPKNTRKPRKPRKDNGKQPADDQDPLEGEDPENVATTKPKRKPRAPKKRTETPAGPENEDGSQEPKRRGRPPREDTPSDAEDRTIDPDMMCMDDLASRNIRVGKLSRREREMRKIDWDAVKLRRREEDARHISTKETQAAVDKLLESGEVEPAPTGPRYHVIDGRIELIQDSGTIDRERDADREIDAMLITEEDDLTTRITNRSFMKNNKRFPNEFVLPGQGKRWNLQSTEVFYQGLRSFGTDFQMIAHMFPGMTRRSIKTKFTREERDNPEIVRDCLRGKSELASHWDQFLAASQLEEESFADADAIKADLEEEEARMREQINDALREKEEREKQKKLAGLTDDGDTADKDGGKGKKKRRQKDKTVTFQEQGVEIVGQVDDDPSWGQE